MDNPGPKLAQDVPARLMLACRCIAGPGIVLFLILLAIDAVAYLVK